MIFEPDDEAGEPSLIIDGVRVPFTMEARVTYGPPEEEDWDDADWDENAPWMIRLPIEMQVELPYEILHPPAAPPPAPPARVPSRADPDPHPEPAMWRLSDIPLPRLPPDRDQPVGARALESLGLDEALDRLSGRRSRLPSVPGLVPATATPDQLGDADDDLQEFGAVPGLATGGMVAGATGYGALDAVFAAGPIGSLDRVLRPVPAAAMPADAGAHGAAPQPAVDRHVLATDDPATSAEPALVLAAYGAQAPVIPRPGGPAGLPVAIAALALSAIEMMEQSRGPDEREVRAAASRLKGELDVIGRRVAEATGDALEAIGHEVQAIADELESLQHRRGQGQLKRNVLKLLTQVRPELKESLNQDPDQTKLVVHHTIPYMDRRAEPARKVLGEWGLSVHDPADAAIVPDTYHRGEDIHGMADKGYNTQVDRWMKDADEAATAEAAKGGRKAGRAVILEALRMHSDVLVGDSRDLRAIDLERLLRTLEQPLPRPDLADPYDWEGYAP